MLSPDTLPLDLAQRRSHRVSLGPIAQAWLPSAPFARRDLIATATLILSHNFASPEDSRRSLVLVKTVTCAPMVSSVTSPAPHLAVSGRPNRLSVLEYVLTSICNEAALVGTP